MSDYNDVISSIDNHNVANGDQSWFSKKIDATGELFSDIGEGIIKGTPSALVAGVDSILNSGIALGNILGIDATPIDTYEVLQGLDSNLGDYYKQHQEGVEIAGFAIGMFVPGTAGVKAMQAAKAGFLGTNIAKSSGLMTSLTRDYSKLAKAELASTNNPFSVLNKNTLQALAQGAGSSVLDMAAFNTAVTLTMFKSPMLDQESVSDLFWNDVRDTAVFGGIGAVFKGFEIYGKITKAGKAADILTFPYKAIEEVPKNAEPLQKVMKYYNDKFSLPEAIGPLPNIEGLTGLKESEGLALITKERETTIARLDGKIREHFNEFAGGDNAIGNQLFDTFSKAKNIDEIFNGLLQVKSVSRVSANERLAYGDVLFPNHKLTAAEFSNISKTGATDMGLFNPKAGEGAIGYKIVGDYSALRIASASSTKGMEVSARDLFNDGVDVVRNANGTLSVNPESKILAPSKERRAPNDRILDLETGNIVDKAVPTLADLATPTKPVKVFGDTVIAGDLNPIKVGKSEAFNPMVGNYLDAHARYIWAQDAKIKWDGIRIGETDLPLLERLYKEDVNLKAETAIYVIGKDGATAAPRGETLRMYIDNRKQAIAKEMKGTPVEEMALRLNTNENWLLGASNGESIKLKAGVDYNKPRYAKMVLDGDNSMYPMLNPNNHTGAIEYARQIDIVKQRNLQNWMNFAKEDGVNFPDEPNWLDPGRTPTRQGAGATLFGFANANFGSAGGWAQTVAQQVDKLLLKRKTATTQAMNLAIGSVRAAGPEATAEAALINNRLLQSEHGWLFHPDGSNTLVKKSDFAILSKDANFVPEEVIDIKSKDTANFFRSHIAANSDRQTHVANLKGAAGVGDNFDPNVLYPVPVDTTKLKHFVIVKPLAPVSLADKSRVIAAKDEATLQRMIGEVDRNQFNVVTKADGERWHKEIGDYQYSLGLNESAVDSSLKREGKLSQHFPTIDEGFFDRSLDWHMRQEEVLTHSMVYHRYSQKFEELRNLGERYTNVATSQFRSITEKLEQSVKDPYNDIVRTALNISRSSEYQPWTNFNNFIKDSIERPINKLRDVFTNSKEVDDVFVAKVNEIAKDLGQGQPFTTAAQVMIANGNIPNKPWIQKFVAKANSLISTTLLQWDTFNAINNVASSAILAAPEMNKLRENILKGNGELVGKLKDLTVVKLPDGSGIELPTTSRMLFNAHNAFTAGGDARAAIVKRFEDIGAISTLSQEMRQMLDHMTLNYSVAGEKDANTALSKMVEFGRKYTGNNIAEQYTRFISAHMAMQLGDIGVSAGVISTKESNELISLFTNRTQGNYLYSQRPIVFQGVVGQAIGLFQTYQFNLMQQMFKHVTEGDNKALAMLTGLQGSIYGMQGLPAFNFFNTHIVGNANGNTEHKDLYTASYTAFGKSLGDWIMYGAGSNALGIVDPSLRVNLYSRGDINPRQLTVLPTSITDIPIVAASTKFVGNILGALNKVSQGGSLIPVVSQAIEHNGLSRPLAGLAQIAQGYTTSNSGALLSTSQDFYSIATLARVGGAKPFDESLALDSLYRINAYHAKDSKDIAELGSAIRSTVISGRNPSPEQVNTFAAEYAKQGGKIEGFNKYFTNLVMQANRSQVNTLAQNIQNPMAKNMQVVMGGVPVPDFMNSPKINP